MQLEKYGPYRMAEKINDVCSLSGLSGVKAFNLKVINENLVSSFDDVFK